VKKKTIANLSSLPERSINIIKSNVGVKKNSNTLVDLNDISVNSGLKFGALYVLHTMLQRIGIVDAVGTCSNGMLIIWLICARILFQGSRLKSSRLSKQYAVKSIIGTDNFNVQLLYKSLDWLCQNQDEIEKTLLSNNGNSKRELFLYDVTSCYFEGQQNELSEYGYNRDGKKGKKQIVIGLLTDIEGEPLSIEVFPGNTADTSTCSKRIEDIKNKFGANSLTVVGDRGMIKGPQIEKLLSNGWNYITAITKPQIEKLLKENIFQLDLFDEELQEIIDDSVRYVLRRNPTRAKEIEINRADKLSKLKEKANEQTNYLKEHVKAKEETAINKIINYASSLKINKWVKISAKDRVINIEIDNDKLAEESKLDGCYVVKSNIVDTEIITKKQLHDRYKDLSQVEWAFRTMKTTLLENRPIYHRLESRTRAICFVSMLAYKLSRAIVMQLTPHKEELLEIMFDNKKDRENQVVPFDEIISELELIQETFLQASGIKIPILLNPGLLGEKILSILKIQQPTPDAIECVH